MARIETIRLVVAIAIIRGWSMHQLDVKSAFLNEPLDKEVYVIQPPGFEILDQEEILRLRKSLYDLKQAPRVWNKRIDNFLSQTSFVKCIYEHGVYLKVLKVVIGANLLIMCLYVDNLLVIRSNEREIEEFKKKMMKEFEMSDPRLLSYFLGIEFKTTENGIVMYQTDNC